MIVELRKSNGRARCRFFGCVKDVKYINDKGKIVKGNICAYIIIPTADVGSYYCRGCIDLIFKEMKKHLDTKLWIFH